MKYNHDIPIEEYFSYHPVITPERQILHDHVNEAALKYAELIYEILDKDDPQVSEFLNQIQFIRMMLNQKITLDEVVNNRK